jgi:hypothetical protein
MKPAHDPARKKTGSVRNALWKTMGKSLAEALGAIQEKDSSPFFEIDPQFDKE